MQQVFKKCPEAADGHSLGNGTTYSQNGHARRNAPVVEIIKREKGGLT